MDRQIYTETGKSLFCAAEAGVIVFYFVYSSRGVSVRVGRRKAGRKGLQGGVGIEFEFEFGFGF